MNPLERLNPGYFLESQDAAAEVVDFVTIIGILILSLSIIGLAGYPVLKNAQEARYIENTKLSFIILAENLNTVALGQAPSKSLELKLYGGSLKVTDESSIVINATNSTNHEITLVEQDIGNIQNSIGDTVVAYEGTGVWVKYPQDVTLNAYRPLFTNQSGALVIPVVEISGNSSVGGNGLSRIKAEGSPAISYYNNVSNVTITIKGNYVGGWKDYFENINKMGWEMSSGTGNTYTAVLNTDKNIDVYILNTKIYTEIE
ncbi:MAG: hypothetical protein FIB08_12240 [Candidatus Methanoperedens sp.]|nr:hypothetical protein [Candidatus Methanoperedens sp.]